MPVFRNDDELYQVLDRLFRRVAERPEIADALLAGKFVLRFRYTDPDGQATIDLRGAGLEWMFGDCELEPDLEMIQSADTAHEFWLGRLNIPAALATRRVVARGPVPKALKLLPAIKPAFAVYHGVLEELGREDLLPDESEPESSAGQLAAQVRQRVAGWLDAVRSDDAPAPRKAAAGRTAPIPTFDGEAPADEVVYRDQELPADEAALHREMLERMELIRVFEERLATAYQKGELPTEAIHLSIGQEAVAVGVCFALSADDTIATTHRGHGHMLAKGADLDGMMAEILAKQTGLCAGKGGSMHVTEAAVGALGANGIVGASPLIAAGAAHSAKQRGTKQVAVAMLGDGATNQGMFHEGLNFAAVFDLPAIFVVENNGYGEFTPLDKHTRVAKLSDRAGSYGMAGETVDGNDPRAVYLAMQRAIERARAGEGPTLLECLTYRWHGHMEGECLAYRTAEEIEAWKKKCPIDRWRKGLIEAGELDAEQAAAITTRTHEQVEAAWERGLQAPEPTDETLFTDVFAPDPAMLWQAEPPAPTGSDTEDERPITYSAALVEALSNEFERDDRVYLLGEDVTTGGYFSVTTGLVDHFGTERIVDTPISEYAIVGTAVGAAMTGRRPVCEILFSDFITTCMDPLVNQAAKLRYMSGGQVSLPLVVRTPGGAGLGMAAQHSQSLEALLTGMPGLIIVAPATPYDAKGLLTAAIRSNNPVLFFENKLAYTTIGSVPEGELVVPLGRAAIKHRGKDVTVVSVGAALGKVLDAAAALAREGIEIEVVDVRTLVPLDLDTILESVARTRRLVTVEDGPLFHGFGAELVAQVVEQAFETLAAAPVRVAGDDVPLPYNSRLENLALPNATRLAEAVRAVCGESRRGSRGSAGGGGAWSRLFGG